MSNNMAYAQNHKNDQIHTKVQTWLANPETVDLPMSSHALTQVDLFVYFHNVLLSSRADDISGSTVVSKKRLRNFDFVV